MERFPIGGAEAGGPRLLIVAGPCVVESAEMCLQVGERVKAACAARGLGYVFKASYRKANRSSGRSFAGPPMDEALEVLARVKRELAVPVLTDVHEVAEVRAAAEVADVLQIPAFLCRQTDLLIAAAKTEKAINIKKGQFVSPWDMKHAVTKVRESGNDKVFLTERGSSFGYNNLVVDMRSLAIMREFAPVVFDATHSVQLPSAGTNGEAVSGGQPQFIPLLSRAAVAAGVDGVFMEVHDNPAQAKSDGANALDLTKLRGVLNELLLVQRAVSSAK